MELRYLTVTSRALDLTYKASKILLQVGMFRKLHFKGNQMAIFLEIVE